MDSKLDIKKEGIQTDNRQRDRPNYVPPWTIEDAANIKGTVKDKGIEKDKEMQLQEPTLYRITNPSDTLLERVHKDILVKAFPNPDDIDTLDSMRTFIANNSKKNIDWDVSQYYVLAFTDDSRDKVLGAMVFGIFARNDYAFIKSEYTATNREEKSPIFGLMLRQRRDFANQEANQLYGKNIEFVINQLADTNKLSAEAISKYCVHPSKVEKIWKVHGFQKIDFPFKMMPITEGSESIDYLDLYIHPWTEEAKQKEHLDAKIMKDIIDASNHFRTCNTPLISYPEYNMMIKQIYNQKNIKIIK